MYRRRIIIFLVVVMMVFASCGNASENAPEKIKVTYIIDVTDQYKEELEKQITLLPDEICESFSGSGWEYIVTDEDSIRMAAGKSEEEIDIAGITLSEEKTIFISSSKDSIRIAAIHEMGHFYDIINGDLSKSDEFTNTFFENGGTYQPSINTGNRELLSIKEFFAYTFADYFQSPDTLKESAPSVYEYFDGRFRQREF